jgi:hypothetical protein
MVVAVIALTGAFTATAVAGPDAITSAVTKKKVKRISKKQANKAIDQRAPGLRVAHANTAGHADTAGHANSATNATNATNAQNANALGGQPASAFAAKTRYASVAPDGTIVEQSGGITLIPGAQAGRYTLDFGVPVAGKAIVVSSGIATDGAFRGTAIAGPCAEPPTGLPGPCEGAGGDSPTRLEVFTSNPANNATADHSFYVALLG